MPALSKASPVHLNIRRNFPFPGVAVSGLVHSVTQIRKQLTEYKQKVKALIRENDDLREQSDERLVELVIYSGIP